MQNQSKAYLYALITVLIWSTMSSAFKITLRYIDFAGMLLIASFVSVVTLFIILLFQKKFVLIKKLRFRDILNSAILGFINPFLYYFVLFKAYSLLKAQVAGTLNYFWPIVLVLLSIPILKQKIGLKSIVAIFVSFFGIIIISTQGRLLSLEFGNIYGVLLAIGSAFLWAFFWLFNLKDKREEVSKLFLNFVFGFIYILITIISFTDISLPDIKGIIGSVYIGLFEMGITYIIWFKALKYSSNTAKVSNLVFLSPFIALMIIRITVGEEIMISTIVGLIFIVSGILLQRYFASSKK
ncbi:MAG: DMT family transporter [Bacteroidales bacterium]|nr:DMT family transporter [Bacteroidales bacterium]